MPNVENPALIRHSEADPPDILEAKVEHLREALSRALRAELLPLVREAVREEIGAARGGPGSAADDPEALLDKDAVAARLNVSPRTVDTLAAEGSLRRVKIRGCVRFSPQAVDAYIRRHVGGGSAGR